MSNPCSRSAGTVLVFFKDFIYYLVLERGEGQEKERKRNINMWLPLPRPLLGTWPETQACALTGNRTGDPSVHRLALNPWSHKQPGILQHSLWGQGLEMAQRHVCTVDSYNTLSVWVGNNLQNIIKWQETRREPLAVNGVEEEYFYVRAWTHTEYPGKGAHSISSNWNTTRIFCGFY